MGKSQRDKLIVCVLGILLCGVVAYFGVPPLGLQPLATVQAEVAKLRTDRKTLDDAVRSAKTQVEGLEKIKKEREVLEVQLKELSQRLPGEREAAQLLRKVEELTLKASLQLSEVKRRPLRTQELYVEIPMEVGVGGGYRDLLKFAEDLGNLERLVTLSEVAVSRPAPGAQPGPGGIVARLVAIVFQTLPEAAPVAKTTP
jgi:type IV pilus assembly protein PilO